MTSPEYQGIGLKLPEFKEHEKGSRKRLALKTVSDFKYRVILNNTKHELKSFPPSWNMARFPSLIKIPSVCKMLTMGWEAKEMMV